MKAPSCAVIIVRRLWQQLVSKKIANKNGGLALVFIREQCSAESEHRLETSRESCHPMSA